VTTPILAEKPIDVLEAGADPHCAASTTPLVDPRPNWWQRLLDGKACFQAALDYLARGWSAVLLCPPDHFRMSPSHINGRGKRKGCKNPGKVPFWKWEHLQQRLATPDEVREQWRKHMDANVGVIMGYVSGIVGIDTDGSSGEAKLAELSGGDLPPTLEFTTPGGGRRRLYGIPEGVKVKTTIHKTGGEHEEVRFQANGAQTVMPPSRHESGRLYEWKPGHGPGEIELAMMPAWLIEQLRPKEEKPTSSRSSSATNAPTRQIPSSRIGCGNVVHSGFSYVDSANRCPLCNGDTDCRTRGAHAVHCRRTSPTAPPPGWSFNKTDAHGFHIFEQADADGIPLSWTSHTYTASAPRRQTQTASHGVPFAVLATMAALAVPTETEEQRADRLEDERKSAKHAKFIANRRPMAPQERQWLADKLFLPPEVFDHLGVQYVVNCYGMHGYAFEERDGNGNLVGLAFRRTAENKADEKRASGGRGLSIPLAFTDAAGARHPSFYTLNPGLPIFIPEGQSDTLALMAMGLPAIGRPSADGGVEHLITLFSHPQFSSDRERMLVIVGDNDAKAGTDLWPGRDGAMKTAQRAADVLNRPVYVAMAPPLFKDVREWLRYHKDWLADPTTGCTLKVLGQELSDILVKNAVAVHPRNSPEGQAAARHTAEVQAAARHIADPAISDAVRDACNRLPDWMTRQTCSQPIAPFGCLTPRPVLMRHDSQRATRACMHDCERIRCPECARKKRRQYADTVVHHLKRWAKANGYSADDPCFYKCHVRDDVWKRVYMSIRKNGGFFFNIGNDDGAALVVCTVKPEYVDPENIEQISANEGIAILYAAIESLPNLREKAFTSSREWKLLKEQPELSKPLRVDGESDEEFKRRQAESRRRHGWRRIGKFKVNLGVVADILTHHNVHFKEVHHDGPYTGWHGFQWDDHDNTDVNATWQAVVDDIMLGEICVTDYGGWGGGGVEGGDGAAGDWEPSIEELFRGARV
jgi:hypothetical protein